MNNLENILKYQELDIKLRKTLDSVERSRAYESMDAARKNFAMTKKVRDDSEKFAESVIEFFEKAKVRLKELTDDAEKICAIAETRDLSEKEMGCLEKIRAEISDLENKVSEKKARSEKTIKDFLEAQEQSKKLRAKFEKDKAEYLKLKEEKTPQINALKKELEALEPEIDPEIIQKYKALAAEKKFPPFVDAYPDKDSFYCRGCGLALSQSKASELKNNSYCVCERCKRIIYKKS